MTSELTEKRKDAMPTVVEIQQAIMNLPKSDYAGLRNCLFEYDWQERDREFEEDVKAGRLDTLTAEALEAKRQGTLKALWSSSPSPLTYPSPLRERTS